LKEGVIRVVEWGKELRRAMSPETGKSAVLLRGHMERRTAGVRWRSTWQRTGGRRCAEVVESGRSVAQIGLGETPGDGATPLTNVDDGEGSSAEQGSRGGEGCMWGCGNSGIPDHRYAGRDAAEMRRKSDGCLVVMCV